MPSLLQCIPDFIFAPAYIYLLVRIFFSPLYFNRFYKFFISTGICGIVSVVFNILVSRPLYPAQFFWIFALFVILNQCGSVGATIGKFYIVVHRFQLLRGKSEIILNTSLSTLIYVQFMLPLFMSSPIILFGMTPQVIGGRSYVLTLSNTGNNIQRILNTTVYSLYFIIAIFLTGWSAVILSRFSKYSEISRKCLKQQRQMIIVTAVCCFTHILKAGHQMGWFYLTISGKSSPAIYEAHILPSYLVVNGLTTYSFPIALVICSRSVRMFLFRHSTPPSQTQSISLSTVVSSVQQ